MNIPKKITPDSIIDSTVEIRYASDKPHEVFPGLFFNAFDDTYTYTSRPLLSSEKELVTTLAVQSLFYNERISIRILPNSLAFNCLDKYIGWDLFRQEIEKALETVYKHKLLSRWVRVGLRYITEYPETDLTECTKFKFSFGLPNLQSISTTFKSDFIYKDNRVILNLRNKVPTLKKQLSKEPLEVPTSIIDIDVIKEPIDDTSLVNLMKVIDEVHNYEKEIFFSLLTEDFLTTLKPEY